MMTDIEKLKSQVRAMKILTSHIESLIGTLSELPEEAIDETRICKIYDDYIENLQRTYVLTITRGAVKFKAIESTLRNVTDALVQDLQPKH